MFGHRPILVSIFLSPCIVAVVPSGEEVQSGLGQPDSVFLPAQHSLGLSGEQTLCAQVINHTC